VTRLIVSARLSETLLWFHSWLLRIPSVGVLVTWWFPFPSGTRVPQAGIVRFGLLPSSFL